MILAIDPGNEQSGVVLIRERDLKPIVAEKITNEELLDNLLMDRYERLEDNYYNDSLKFIYRKDEKMNLCGSMKAKDSNIVQALIDRFAPNTPNKGKGTKKEPGWFYGFKKDIWQAYAVAVTYYDMYLNGGNISE